MDLSTVRSAWAGGVVHAGRWGLVVGLLALVVGAGGALVHAQDRPAGRRDSLTLVDRYRMARYRYLVQQVIADGSVRTLPPEPIPTQVDTLVGQSPPADTAVVSADTTSSFPIDEVRPVHHMERSWFRDRYEGTEWSFLGTSSRLTFLDTTRTRDLRARLQAEFGAPTHTLAEEDLSAWRQTPDSSRDGLLQFAYWFVVNDSIPVRVMDVNGPTERGLIVSTDHAYRDRLVALRTALLRPLRREERAPYVDYYYEEETRRWYRVGYDGQSFFRERISRFDIVRGQRPRLDTVRTTPPAPDDEASGAAGSP